MGGKVFNYQKAEKLLDPKRQELIPIDRVLQLLDVNKEDIVSDLGCGNGYLTLPIAQKVNTNVVAVDLQAEMLELLEKRAMEANVGNVTLVQASLEKAGLDHHSMDKIVSAFVLHEVPELEKVMSDLHKALKPNGKWLILDWEAIEMEMGPPLHERISSGRMADLLDEKGFQTEVGYFNQGVYYIVAAKKEA
ncbi:class I SAM-dependent methyltransferase [Falsibacillus albus]|uniref:Class I SAM-dependent methyltransferase n=1 Tax=Falsibacillus albus TaxID=2478915 RepID=A0A3L7K103_9BACI|nr:class I SAM-dependent methyltransferase [Falsibacillus albus]RLQ96753.1 class I SAM-dependent methyltransferase [Falsibacillus albus]